VTTRSLLLASVAYLAVGLAAGGLLANSGAGAGKSDALRDEAVVAIRAVSNKEAKHDRLPVSFKVASLEPEVTGSLSFAAPVQGPAVSLRDDPLETRRAAPIASPTQAGKAVPKRKPTVDLLSDEQIAGVKERMKLTPYQQQQWPAVEAALRKLATRFHWDHKSIPAVDPDSPEVQELESAALPLLFSLSEDQKREVRALARTIGLEAVASAI